VECRYWPFQLIALRAGCLMVTVLAGIAEFECSLIFRGMAEGRAPRHGRTQRVRPQAEDDEALGARGPEARGGRRAAAGNRIELRGRSLKN
jgi:hypothetical protein